MLRLTSSLRPIDVAGSVPPKRAERILEDLGVELPLTVEQLRARAVRSLGEERVTLAWQFVRAAVLTRRYDELANIASLTIGGDQLGPQWWDEPVVSAYPRDWNVFSTEFRALEDADAADDPTVAVTPAEVLTGRFGYAPSWPYGGTALGTLASVIADDVAGPAADFVDLNWPGCHRIEFPPGVGPGEEVVLAFDSGGRIRGTTFIDEDVRQAVRVDLDRYWHSKPANVNWAVGVTLQGTVLRLPDEKPGGRDDLWSGQLTADDRRLVVALQNWSATVGVPARLCEPTWTSREQVAAAWVEARAEWGSDAITWPGVAGGHRHRVEQVTACVLDGLPPHEYDLRELGLLD